METEKNIVKMVCMLLFSLTLIMCGNQTNEIADTDKTQAEEALEMVNMMNISDLYVLGQNASLDREVQLLIVQGGAGLELNTDRTLPYHNTDTLSLIHVHQAQTLETYVEIELGDDEYGDTDERRNAETQADQYNLISAAILHRVTQHFKDQRKRVYILASSFGASLILKTFQEYGNTAHKAAIISGRVTYPLEAVNAYRRGISFDFTGATTIEEHGFSNAPNLRILSASIFKPRYAEILNETSFENVFYVFVTTDTAVGPLSAEEQDFIRARGARLREFPPAEDNPDNRSQGGHLDPIFVEEYANEIIDWFNE